MRIAMIGTGYVGLVSGACFSDFGHSVTCIDKDESKIAALQRGELPIYEPGLNQLVASNVAAGRLDFSLDLKNAVAQAEAVFIAVGTPSRRGDGHADLSYVHAAAREIAVNLRGFTVVITKSTVPVGTGDDVERIIAEINPTADVVVASNPEFLREGAAIRDFKHPDRIVVGTDDERARKVISEIYRPLYLNQPPTMYTGRRTAELIKYAANAFLATKISFINEIADLAERAALTSRRLHAASASTTVSAANFYMQARVSAALAFPRIPAPWSKPLRITAYRCASSKRYSRSMTTASAQWRERLRPHLAAVCVARQSVCSA